MYVIFKITGWGNVMSWRGKLLDNLGPEVWGIEEMNWVVHGEEIDKKQWKQIQYIGVHK